MLKDGTYAAWFKTPLNHGTGIVHVADGKIWGRDSIMTYSGTCQVDGERFTGVLLTKRHSEGHDTVFGIDTLTIRIEGTCVGKIATYVGEADEVPGLVLQGTLIRSEQATPTPEQTTPQPAFNLDKLPKLPKRSR